MAKAKKIKKKKHVKYPKKPKASAPLSSWEKYDEKVKAVDKKNAENLAEYNKKKNSHISGLKKKEKLIKKHSS
jgi:hypothetical protein